MATFSEQWLGFAGSLIGAIVAVVGAVLVFEYQRGSDARQKRRLVRDRINRIRTLAAFFQLADHEALRLKAHRTVRDVVEEIGDSFKVAELIVNDNCQSHVSFARAYVEFKQAKIDVDELVNEGRNWRDVQGSDFGQLNYLAHCASRSCARIADTL